MTRIHWSYESKQVVPYSGKSRECSLTVHFERRCGHDCAFKEGRVVVIESKQTAVEGVCDRFPGSHGCERMWECHFLNSKQASFKER
jgi:hypothetical protein